MLVKDSKLHLIPQGSIKKECFDCEKEVYLSLSGQKMLKESSEILICCINCLKINEETKFSAVPGAFEEFNKHINILNNYNSN